VLEALGSAGFANLQVLSNKTGLKMLAGRLHAPQLARNALDEDLIYSSSFGPNSPLTAVRLPTVALARKTYESAIAVKEGRLPVAARDALPQSFDRTRLRVQRVCNVVVASYDAGEDGGLAARLDRAVAALREEC